MQTVELDQMMQARTHMEVKQGPGTGFKSVGAGTCYKLEMGWTPSLGNDPDGRDRSNDVDLCS